MAVRQKIYTYLLFLSLVLALQFLDLSALAQGPTSTVKHIPFQYDAAQGNGLVIQARINDGPPLPFLLDTGSEFYVAVEDWVAEAAHFPLTGEVFDTKPGNIKLSETTRQNFQIMGTNVPNSMNFLGCPLLVGALDVQNEKGTNGRMAGIIGMPLIASANLQIDFDAKIIYWDFHPHAPPAGALTFPLQNEPARPRYFVTLPTPNADPIGPMIPQRAKATSPIRLLLDTGAQVSTLPIDLISRLHPHAAFLSFSSDHVHTYLEVGWLIPDLSACGLNIKNIEVVEDSLREPAIGMNILSQFKPTLDFPNQRLWLQPRQGGAWVSRKKGFVGLKISEENVVDDVRPDSPAARAGVRLGMTLMAVDGQPIASVLPIFQHDLINGDAGTTAVLQFVIPGGKRKTIKITRLSEDDPATFLPVGVRVRVSPLRFLQGYGVMVDAILCSSEAYSAGLRAGDVLRSINGNVLLAKTYNDTATKLLPQVVALLKKPSSKLTLTVRHLGAKDVQTVTLSLPEQVVLLTVKVKPMTIVAP